MLIYKIESFDGRYYIGQTINSLSRRIAHYKNVVKRHLSGKNKSKQYVIRAMAKYGFENFSFQIIDKAKTQEELDAKERFWIKIYSSNIKGIGFNIALGGCGGCKTSIETRKRMSEIRKGKPIHDDRFKNKLSENNRNRVWTEEMKKKSSISKCKLSVEQISAIINEYNLGQVSYKDLANKHHCSIRTIARYLNNEIKGLL